MNRSKRDTEQELGVPDRDTEIETIEKIVATTAKDNILTRIFEVLSEREREILWGYSLQTDAQELGYALGLEKQSIQNDLKIIREKLGIDTRPELARRVFSALLAKAIKS